MKSYLLLMAFVCSSMFTFAQGGQQRTPEERLTAAMEKLAPLKLDAEATEKTKAVMADFFSKQQAAMQEMRESGNMDREAMMAKRKELAEARDAKLKNIFTAEQMKQWVEEIEPSLRPQRRPNN